MRKTLLVFLPTILLAVAAHASEVAAGIPILQVRTPPGSPVELIPIKTYAQPISQRSALRIEFMLKNTSGEFVSSVEFVADVYSSSGKLKGFYGFLVTTQLTPGDERFVLAKSDAFKLSPGDRVVLGPREVKTKSFSWVAPEPKAPLQEEGPPTQSQSGPSTITPGVLDCEAKCINAEARCDAKCFCGVQSFSCTCSEGSLSYSCSCFICSQ